MEEHFIYSRPVVVTEDKIKEALAKQANQKALKAALDQQIQEAERLKAEAHRAKGKKRAAAAAAAAGRSNGTPAPLPPPTHAAENSSGGAGPSPPSRGEQQDGGRDVAPTRYTFSFKEGHGTFEMTDRSARPLQETLQPSSAEGRSRAGGGGDSGGLASGQQDKKRAHSKHSPVPARRTPSSREGREREPPKPSPGAAAAPAGGEYQTNSLPANFKLGKDAGGARKPASREQPRRLFSREKGSERSTGDAAGGYDTQSLPVELIYKLSQGNALPAVGPGANHSGQPPSRVKLPHPPRLTSPSASRISDSMGMRSPMSLNSIPSNGHASAVRDRSVPLSPRSEDRSGRPPPSPRGGKASARLATPLDSPGGGGRLSGRPTGGFLPPLGGRRESDTIEMSAVFDPRTPTREHDAGGPRRRVSGDGRHDRSPPPPGASPPSDAAAAELARKLAEREKGWAQQVKQLKAELRKARQKAGAGKGGKAEEAAGRPPRRAETAPDPPAHPPGRGPRGAAAVSNGNGNGNGNGAGGATGRARRAEGGGDHNAPLARPTRLEKMDFSKAHIFSRDTFRPITAPEDANSYFGNLLASPLPRTPLPLEKPKPSPLPTQPLASAAAANRDLESHVTAKAASFSPDQSDSATHKTATQNSAHTATSGEESLKLASLTTRQVTLGLPDYGDGEPVPIEFMHLQQFVDAQIITANQAANLWDFFALSVPAELGGSGDGDAGEGEQGRDGRGHDNAEMESHTIEVEEMTAPRRASAGSSRHEAERAEEEDEQEGGGDDHDDDDDDGFFVPHSPSVPPPNAVLAPALRRKISQLHSEEAAMLLQHHQQLRNGRQRPSLPTSETAPRRTSSSSSGGGKSGAARQAAAGRKTSPAQEARPPRPASSDSEGEGTFDTYSELRLSRNVRASGGD